MAVPRKMQISLEDTVYYHCISRCVRKAYLCGVDSNTGQSYQHRRDWIETRLLMLASIFAIDICSYAVMSNHLHLVLRVDINKATAWSDKEVLQCWHQIFKGTLLTQRYMKEEKLNPIQLTLVMESIKKYRNRLIDISWFMRALNEPIARKANKEDQCTGRFWEGRFKSQALLDDAAVLACMAYVDLNPVRANIADTPELSNFTSIKRRIQSAISGKQPPELLPFVGNEKLKMPIGLLFSVNDYLQLINETSLIIKNKKHRDIALSSIAILDKLNIPQENWLKITSEFGGLFKGPVGTLQELTRYCRHLKKRRRQGASICQKLFAHRLVK